jgi:GTP-binding protein
MLLPSVAIVGRPNVGKSSLFNRLVGRPVAIVDPTAGVTRDRVLHEVRREGIRFDLIDTGGIGIVDEAKLEADVETQIARAIEHADHIVFLVDVRDGVTPLDKDIAARLRPHGERVTLVANKVDHDALESEAAIFGQLGLGEAMSVSAEQVRGFLDLLDELGRHIPIPAKLEEAESAASTDDRLRICLAGRRNVGKSSLTNAILGEERVIVADHPGTTRDAVDIAFERGDDRYLLIDTAGLRKKRQLSQDLEFYAACRTERAIRRTDVVLLVLDASDELGQVDKKLAHFCEVEGKPTAVVVNKWDIAREGGAELAQYQKWLKDRLPGLRHAPLHITSAIEGKGVEGLLKLAQELNEENQIRIPTNEVNRLLEAAVARRRPRRVGPSVTKIYYGTQAETTPPTFIVFVNRTDWIESGYSRYLENYLRERTALKRVPIRIVFKARESQFHENNDQRLRTDSLTKAERSTGLILPKGFRHGKKMGMKSGKKGGPPRRGRRA